MTREEAKRAAEVMLAYANGEEIERYDDYEGRWKEITNCAFDWFTCDYRVKLKGKFDPKTLQPFDKVLVRGGCSKYQCWYADFVAAPIIDNDTRCCTIASIDSNMVIPYNEDTKHLAGTNKEAPKYYRYWEE